MGEKGYLISDTNYVNIFLPLSNSLQYEYSFDKLGKLPNSTGCMATLIGVCFSSWPNISSAQIYS